MKLINNSAIGICLLVSLSAHSQDTSNDTTRKSTAPVNVTDPAQKSENKKEEYKSKEWRQGNEAITDTTKGSGDRLRSSMRKKAQKQHGVAPPPPPPPPPAKPQ